MRGSGRQRHAAVRQEEAGELPCRPPHASGPLCPELCHQSRLGACQRRSPQTCNPPADGRDPCGWQGGGSQTDNKATGDLRSKPAASAARPGAAAAAPAKGGGAAPGAKPPGAGAAGIGMAPGSAGGKGAGKKNGPLEALPAFKGAPRPLDPERGFGVRARNTRVTALCTARRCRFERAASSVHQEAPPVQSANGFQRGERRAG